MEQKELLESGTTVDTLEWLKKNGEVEVRKFGGALYVVGAGKVTRLVDDFPLPETARFTSLSAILRYADALGTDDLCLEVQTHKDVLLVGGRNANLQIPIFASVSAYRPGLPSDWSNPLELAYLVGRNVEPGDDRDALIKILSDVRMEDASIQRIEGLAVKVTAERKLSGKGFHEVTTPYFQLAPRRTFAEVHQPESAYLFEAKEINGHPQIRLTCADGDDWKLEAVHNVGGWLEAEAEIHGIDVTVIY